MSAPAATADTLLRQAWLWFRGSQAGRLAFVTSTYCFTYALHLLFLDLPLWRHL